MGMHRYLAPEVLLYTEYDGAKSDMWSVGVVLFVMLTGELTAHHFFSQGPLVLTTKHGKHLLTDHVPHARR